MDAREKVERIMAMEPWSMLARLQLRAEIIHHPNGSIEAKIPDIGITAIQIGGRDPEYLAHFDVALRAFRSHWPKSRRERVWRAYRTGNREEVPDPELEMELMLEALGVCYDNMAR